MEKKLTPGFEDYIEAIYVIQLEKKVVRVKDISKQLDVSMPSVNGALKSLKKRNIVNHQKYGYVELTSKGEEIAEEIFFRHKLITNFFMKVLDIPELAAGVDACKIEHYLSKLTIERLSKFIEFIDSCPDQATPKFIENFKYYYKHGKRKQ